MLRASPITLTRRSAPTSPAQRERFTNNQGAPPMSNTATLPNRAKKGVGLSGITAGNTALCTVGRTGNDLHYRGYDILDVAEQCEFEEIAYLLVHGTLPTRAELTGYKARLRAWRGLPASVKQTPAA